MNKLPIQHVALIPDGNRRWAKAHAVRAQSQLYQKGADNILGIAEAAVKLGIPYVTFWASSYANLCDRSPGTVAALQDMYEKKFRELTTHPIIHDNQVRIEVLGEWRELLRPSTIEAAEAAMTATAKYKTMVVTILIGYDGRRERGQAVKTLLEDYDTNLMTPPPDLATAEALLRNYAWTGHLPDADLIIRTGAWEDPHTSAGFLTFLNAESQFAFPQVLWPDFTPELFTKAVEQCAARERRLGR